MTEVVRPRILLVDKEINVLESPGRHLRPHFDGTSSTATASERARPARQRCDSFPVLARNRFSDAVGACQGVNPCPLIRFSIKPQPRPHEASRPYAADRLQKRRVVHSPASFVPAKCRQWSAARLPRGAAHIGVLPERRKSH